MKLGISPRSSSSVCSLNDAVVDFARSKCAHGNSGKRIDATGQIGAEGLVPIRVLREGHDAKLLGVGEVLDVVVTLVTGSDSMNELPGQEVHDLCEERLVEVHALLHQ